MYPIINKTNSILNELNRISKTVISQMNTYALCIQNHGTWNMSSCIHLGTFMYNLS